MNLTPLPPPYGPREGADGSEQGVSPALLKHDSLLAQEVFEVLRLDGAHLFVGFLHRFELLLKISRAHDRPFVAHLVHSLVDGQTRAKGLEDDDTREYIRSLTTPQPLTPPRARLFHHWQRRAVCVLNEFNGCGKTPTNKNNDIKRMAPPTTINVKKPVSTVPTPNLTSSLSKTLLRPCLGRANAGSIAMTSSYSCRVVGLVSTGAHGLARRQIFKINYKSVIASYSFTT